VAENDEKNSTKDLMAFFSTEEKPLKVAEFGEFWKSLSDEEKAYYREADLT
jgi:hypothetical protein